MGRDDSYENRVKRITKTVIIVCIIVTVFCIFLTSIPVKTREPLPAGSVNETDYYNADYRDYFMHDRFVVEEGLKHFYNKTGIQPYIYFTITINDPDTVPSDRDIKAYARALYPRLFTDESHLLLVFYFNYPKDVNMHYSLAGSKAESVMDPEATGILSNYLEHYNNDTTLPFDETFGKAFSDAADLIMSVTPPPWITVLIVLGVLIILFMLLLLLINIRKQRYLKAQQNAEILRTPLKQFGKTGDEAEKPASHYEDNTMGHAGGDYMNTDTINQEVQIKRQMNENAAEVKRYTALARQALKAGNEDDARIFIEKKQMLEVECEALNTSYSDVIRVKQMSEVTMDGMRGNTAGSNTGCVSFEANNLPKDEAEILAEKYAARNNTAE